ncbi:helicase-related protein [Paenibacillus sp. Leaf72]|uniref:helicase-related protein n=1 Tax=Paenibacillus sp. Leaf72 TaxID=1736234 RepID=UPI0007020D31|nr:helicase-related protein [Paenibacillus sp. Leaf72]KQN96852.1 hypothetical protein ASF12_22550 [Paenibacillus sp. Leaf72]
MEKLLLKVQELLQMSDRNSGRMNRLSIQMKMDNLTSYLKIGTEELWDKIKEYLFGAKTLEDLSQIKLGSKLIPTSEMLKDVLEFAISNIQQIHFENDGKIFKAYVKTIMLDSDEETIVGIYFTGNFTACRAIHALFYNSREIFVTHLITEKTTKYYSNFQYRRVEEIIDKVCHTFLLPRLAIVEEYKEVCMEADASNQIHPDRILMSRDGNVEELAGQFLAQKYSLPKTKDWADLYLSLIPNNNWSEIKMVHTDSAGEGHKVRAIVIKSMKEEEVLALINQGIMNGRLNVFSETGDPAILTEGMTTEEYLRTNGKMLATKIDQYLKPLYEGHTYSPFLGQTKRISLPAQARAVMGVLAVLQRKYSVFLIGDMGSGKTQMSLTAVFALMKKRNASGAQDGISVLIIAPSIIIPKWAGQEIPKILGDQIVHCTIINSTEDALQYVKKIKSGYRVPKGHIEFVLVSTDRMKLTANKFVLGAIWKHQRNLWCCPDCGRGLKSPKSKTNDDVMATWKDAVELPVRPPNRSELREAYLNGTMGANGLPLNYIKRYTSLIRQFECLCKSGEKSVIVHKKSADSEKKERKRFCTMARPAVKDRGEDRNKPRWMIAEIFQKHLKNHFHVGLFDEIQQMKASDSGRGLAFHKLLKSCKKAMFLTGTLTNGASSSIQATLWRSDSKSLIEEGFKHNTTKELWAQKYGVIEKITYLDEESEGIIGRTTNRRSERVQVTEKPGIAPQLVARHLLHKSVFVELADLGLPLVRLKEEPIIVPLDEEHDAAYQLFHNRLYNACKEFQQELKSKAWAKFNPATLNYAAQPQLENVVEFVDENGTILHTVKAETFPEDYLTSTERRLIDDVKNELKDNRGCIIFTHYTGIFRTNQRIQKILREKGIESEILDVNTTSSVGRFEWLEKHREKGTKVLIMSASLVQVGLDLLEWPTLMFWQMNDNIDVLRQASRRAWRIGQSLECRVRYYVSEKTQQMAQFQRLMRRRIQALLVEGRIERSDNLAQYANDDSSNLTRDLAGSFSATELTETWKTAAEKDMDANLKIVNEEDYENAIKEAFVRLTAETKRLCGVTDLVQFDGNLVTTEVVPLDTTEIVQSGPLSESVGELDLFSFNLTVNTIKTKLRGSSELLIQEQIAFDFGL